MANSPDELVKGIITGTLSDTAAKLVESDVSKALLFPAAAETGQLLAEISSLVRFYATDNLERLFPKWSRHRQKPLTEQEFRRVMPLLQAASMETDDDMQERWARLLDSVANQTLGAMPSFGQCLAQMTPEEANFLDFLWHRRRTFLIRGTTISVFNSFYEVEFKEGMQKTDFGKSWQSDLNNECAVILADLVRLGIMQLRTKAQKDKVGERLEEKLANHTGVRESLGVYNLLTIYELSPYGNRFLLATAGKGDDEEERHWDSVLTALSQT